MGQILVAEVDEVGEDIKVFQDPAKILMVMKGGKLHKDPRACARPLQSTSQGSSTTKSLRDADAAAGGDERG